MYQTKKSHSKSITHWEEYLGFLNKLCFLDFPTFQHLSSVLGCSLPFSNSLCLQASFPFFSTGVRFTTELPVLLMHNVVHPSPLHICWLTSFLYGTNFPPHRKKSLHFLSFHSLLLQQMLSVPPQKEKIHPNIW